MAFDDRDPKFERALAQHLRGGAAQATCPDAETLAAYHERNLSIDEMARWKEHISACEACQEALALVKRRKTSLPRIGKNGRCMNRCRCQECIQPAMRSERFRRLPLPSRFFAAGRCFYAGPFL